MADATGLRGRVEASPERIVEILGAAELYPQWQGGILATEVHERDDAGRAALVTLQVDAKVRRISYTARYWYDLAAGRVGFDLVRGDLKDISGRYTLSPLGDGSTEVVIDITTDIGFFVPGPIKRRIRDQALATALQDLQRRARDLG